MLTILIGHRGVGKTHLLKQIEQRFKKTNQPGLFFDLDFEIERASQKSILELFQKGESCFRKWEQKVFKKITSSLPKNQACFLSAGAGCIFKKKPGWNVIYLFRESDKTGRIFCGRPPLSRLSPLKEWGRLYKKRAKYYLTQADRCLYKREHFKNLEEADLLCLGLKELSKPFFSYRLYPQLLPPDQKGLKKFLQSRLKWGIRFFELNDADCSLKFIRQVQSLLAPDKILFSSQEGNKFLSIKNKKHWSWDLSLGAPPPLAEILSVHERGSKTLSSLLKELSQYKTQHIKLAVEIHSLRELKLAFDWRQKAPQTRSFLPRSSTGKWLWFRQIFGPLMKLNFIKEHPLALTKYQEILDQPYLSEALPFVNINRVNINRVNINQLNSKQPNLNCLNAYKINKTKALRLAGIIAHPVKSLATPGEQSSFFYKKHSIPVLALNLEERELNKANLKILSEFGFVFFAVSSPLKKRAFLQADSSDSLSKEFQSGNTLIFKNKKWRVFNTDWEGLKSLKKYNLSSTFVWGGGGTRPVLKKLLPKAHFYSARKAQAQGSKNSSPQPPRPAGPAVLIWAVGRQRMEEGCQWPPKNWRPAQVIDINYTKDSPGLEYALKVKAKYTNGWRFFKRQAKKQREIFQKEFELS